MVGEACPVVVFEHGMCRNQGLDHDVIDVVLQFVHIHSLLLHLPVEGAQSALTPVLLVSDEFLRSLVDSIVCQVHEDFILHKKNVIFENFYVSNIDTEAKLHFAYTSKNMTDNVTGKN